ncbi:MAG: hypothetical protein P1U74_01355 [Legionellaceae bacterium]|nr:hypothetical protein [Legionellaceae bacterium]
MNISKKLVNKIKQAGVCASAFLLATEVHATDRLAGAMQGDIQDMLGGSGTFWKIFILVDIILSAAMAVKTKNPMVFVGVFVIALLPAFLINTFVF